MKIDKLAPYKIINKLYKYDFNLYKVVYFAYKNIKEKAEINLIKRVVKPGMVVLDIGSNIGFYTLLFSDLVGDKGVVYSFEPEKTNFKHLKKLCFGKKNIILNNYAVGDEDAEIKLYASDELNVDHLTYDDGSKRKSVSVKSVKIDSFLKTNKADFIKIDTQGFELNVIRGMIKTLRKSKNLVLLSEFSPSDLKRAGSSANELLGLLNRVGMKTKFLEEDYKERIFNKNQGRLSYVNLVASR